MADRHLHPCAFLGKWAIRAHHENLGPGSYTRAKIPLYVGVQVLDVPRRRDASDFSEGHELQPFHADMLLKAGPAVEGVSLDYQAQFGRIVDCRLLAEALRGKSMHALRATQDRAGISFAKSAKI